MPPESIVADIIRQVPTTWFSAIAVSLPPIAKLEVSYQCDFNAKADYDNKPK
ncbi:hypothetical protein GOB27_29995 [Sinorhizobium meliloti]|nr:hypothetical protein [Sinorhizobium meliloti]